MYAAVALLVCLVFVALSLWHFYMALATTSGTSGAVLSVDGKPLFVPTRKATLTLEADDAA
jgi:hypothetical protein